MPIYDREKEYLRLLSERELTVSELATRLYVSEPTVRRDILAMKERELVNSRRGRVSLNVHSPDKRVPAFLRELSEGEKKRKIAEKAKAQIRDGMVVMLDASTTAYCLVEELADFRNLFVITSGARTAIALAELGIRAICTGGEIIPESYSYIGGDALRTLSAYNADVAFFSCHTLSEDGIAADNSIAENDIRRVMIRNSKKSFLLCDSTKFNRTSLNTLCNVKELDGIISD